MNETQVMNAAALILMKHDIDEKLSKLLGNGKAKRKAKPNGEIKAKPKRKPSNKRVLHGRYLGHIRSLTAKQRKQVSKTRADKGYVAAIREAKALKIGGVIPS